MHCQKQSKAKQIPGSLYRKKSWTRWIFLHYPWLCYLYLENPEKYGSNYLSDGLQMYVINQMVYLTDFYYFIEQVKIAEWWSVIYFMKLAWNVYLFSAQRFVSFQIWPNYFLCSEAFPNVLSLGLSAASLERHPLTSPNPYSCKLLYFQWCAGKSLPLAPQDKSPEPWLA